MIFAFHSTSSVTAVARGKDDWRLIFGHVETFWFDAGTWIFYDPQGRRSSIRAIPDGDDAEMEIARIYREAEYLIRAPQVPTELKFPLHPTMTCASQCAALIGFRAYTPSGLRKKLLKHGAEIIHGPSPAEND